LVAEWAMDDGAPEALSETDIAAICRQYIVDEFLLGVGTIEDDGSLLESGAIDSTGIVELATWLEVRFGIHVDDDDMTTSNLDSVERIARFVARRRAAAGRRRPE